MSQIKNRDTKCESEFRKSIWVHGIRGYRLRAKITGKPDLYFPKKKLVIFIDGCFWHKCPKCFVQPISNKKFWDSKIATNVARDKKVNALLKKERIRIVRFWEHEIHRDNQRCCRKLMKKLDQL